MVATSKYEEALDHLRYGNEVEICYPDTDGITENTELCNPHNETRQVQVTDDMGNEQWFSYTEAEDYLQEAQEVNCGSFRLK